MIDYVAQTGSTNADLVARLSGGEYLPEGYWLVADRQIAGRGRLGRSWSDGSGNFMGSSVIQRGPGDPPPASLALVAGLAVHEAIAGVFDSSDSVACVRPILKWPNDVLVDGGKLAGILLEMVGNAVVVGIGVNIVAAPSVEGRKVVSLADYGLNVSRDAFAERLAGCLDAEISRWRMSGLAPIIRRWQTAAHPEGTALTVHPPGEAALNGNFGGLTGDGNLVLRLSDGAQRVIHAGDVFLKD